MIITTLTDTVVMICDVTTECNGYVIRAHVILCNDITEIACVVYHENAVYALLLISLWNVKLTTLH